MDPTRKADGFHNDPASRIVRLLARAERDLARSFLRAVSFIRDAVTLKDLEAMILAGRIEEAISTATQAFSAFSYDYISVVVASAKDTAGFLGNELRILTAFDQSNLRAVAEMQRNSLRLIREFTEGQRLATRQALLDGIQRGLNPRQQAIAFRSSIGLTARQELAVENYRRLLTDGSAEALQRKLRDRRFDRTVSSAIANDEQLSKAQIERMVGRYRERYLKYRSETIARTESLRSVHQGNDLMYAQAIDDGTLAADDIEQFWITAKDERVRDPAIGSSTSHRSMEGQVQPIGSPFISGAGNQLMHPGDPNAPGEETIMCRCVVTRRFRAPAEPVAAAA